MRLLDAFKDARRRRDGAAYGSPAWDAADVDIERLQRQIFDVSFEEPEPGGRGRDDVGRVALGPDDELGHPEHATD